MDIRKHVYIAFQNEAPITDLLDNAPPFVKRTSIELNPRHRSSVMISMIDKFQNKYTFHFFAYLTFVAKLML